jgi:transcription antitermination factor NusG
MVERAFLARYIFLENAGVGSISGIRRHSSITAVVRIGEIPALIAGEVIDEIRSREIAGYIKLEEPAQTPCLFRPGQRVKITEGAYQGIGGVFYRRSGEQRALLFLRWFGRTTRAEIGLSSLVLA